MKNQCLLVFDFDRTVADTFQKSPNGIGVHEACRHAVRTIFGDTGIEIYDQIGGLRNSAPEELVADILKESSSRQGLMEVAKICFDAKEKSLCDLVPDGKGFPMEWGAEPDGWQRTISEMFVRIKLSHLLCEIGSTFPDHTIWPRPCEGILEFFNSITWLKQNKGIDVKTAILSSGHDEFVYKTFQVWGINCPDILITNDDLRGRDYPWEMERKIKPSAFLFDLVHFRWLQLQGVAKNDERLIEQVMRTRDRMMYFGDDPNKDGKLAQDAKVPFGWFNPRGEVNKITNSNLVFTFKNWSPKAELLRQDKIIEIFQASSPFSKIVPLFA